MLVMTTSPLTLSAFCEPHRVLLFLMPCDATRCSAAKPLVILLFSPLHLLMSRASVSLRNKTALLHYGLSKPLPINSPPIQIHFKFFVLVRALSVCFYTGCVPGFLACGHMQQLQPPLFTAVSVPITFLCSPGGPSAQNTLSFPMILLICWIRFVFLAANFFSFTWFSLVSFLFQGIRDVRAHAPRARAFVCVLGAPLRVFIINLLLGYS